MEKKQKKKKNTVIKRQNEIDVNKSAAVQTFMNTEFNP